VDASKAIQLINSLIQEADSVRCDRNLFDGWQRKCRTVLERIFGKGSRQSQDLMKVDYKFYGTCNIGDDGPLIQAFNDGLEKLKVVLRSCIWEIETLGMPVVESAINSGQSEAAIETICNQFHAVVRQLGNRHDNRPTLEITDEYDVQDLFHALLRLYFDDIRREEWTPSYAGKSTRMDFLLKNEGIVIEIKKTGNGLDAKKVGEELIIDIAHYRSHPDFKMLVCFVYDPENRIVNPTGLENDLSRQSDEFVVKVLICPKD